MRGEDSPVVIGRRHPEEVTEIPSLTPNRSLMSHPRCDDVKNIRLERPLVVLDLETTGTKVQTDRIVEISLLKLLPDGTNQIKTRRLNPGIPIPAEATAIHGITDPDVANKYFFRQIARSLATYIEAVTSAATISRYSISECW